MGAAGWNGSGRQDGESKRSRKRDANGHVNGHAKARPYCDGDGTTHSGTLGEHKKKAAREGRPFLDQL